MLGLVALITLLSSLIAIIFLSSARSARGSVRGVERLQVQAAVEGAAVLLSTGDLQSSSSVNIGNCEVLLTPIDSSADSLSTGSAVSLTGTLLVNGSPRYSRSYQATVSESRISLDPIP